MLGSGTQLVAGQGRLLGHVNQANVHDLTQVITWADRAKTNKKAANQTPDEMITRIFKERK